jgi:hypothetical protein
MLNIEKIGREDADDSVTPSPKKGKKSKKGEHDHIQTGNDLGLILTERKVQKWKVLVLDQFCFDVLGPLFKVGDLRAMGVTLVMNINDKRQPIPDAPAVYFVRPTKDNIDIICKVCTTVTTTNVDRIAKMIYMKVSMSIFAEVTTNEIYWMIWQRKWFSRKVRTRYQNYSIST